MACAVCHKIYLYSEEDNLDSDARPHVCKTCGHGFALKIELKRHTLQHSNGSSYVCVSCSKENNEGDNTESNLKLPKTSEEYTCLVCKESFFTKRSLIKHTNKEHSMRSRYDCPVCNESFDSSFDLKQHSVVHVIKVGRKKKTEEDDLDNYVPPQKKERKISHKPAKSKNLFCSNCNKSFAYQACLEKHLQKCAGSVHSTNKVAKKKIKIKIPNFDNTDKLYECSVCGKGFDRKKALDGHELTHLLNDENSSGNEDAHESEYSRESEDAEESEDFEEYDNTPQKKSRRSVKNIIKKSFSCDYCNFVCFSKVTLKKHALNHDSISKGAGIKGSSHECIKCKGIFSCAEELSEHKCPKVKEKKTNSKLLDCEKRYMLGCKYCEKEFLTNKCLQKHLQLHEIRNKDNLTPQKKESSWKTSLSVPSDDADSSPSAKVTKSPQMNSAVNSDEDFSLVYKFPKVRDKNFACDICGKRFAGETCLRKHIDRHSLSSITKRSPTKKLKTPQTLICEYCQEEFTGKRGAYVKHIHSHTPEVCGICDKRFVDRQGLREHCKIHVGTEEGRMFMECSQKALDAKNGVPPPEPKVEYIYLILP